MPAPHTHVKRKTEDAIEGLLNLLKKNELSGVTFFKGLSLSELTTPRVEIVAPRAEPEIIGATTTGNFNLEGVMITVVSHAGDADRGGHARRCGAVEDILMRGDVEDQINNSIGVTDYEIFEPGWTPGIGEDSIDEHEIRSEYLVAVYCRPSASEG